MTESQSKTLEKLSKFVSELKALTFPSSNVSIELAQLVSTAIESYLKGESKSLDKAFGLTPKRGKPGAPKHRKVIATKILKKQLAGKSWKEIKNELDEDGQINKSDFIVPDERELRRIAKEFEVETWSEELIRRADIRDKQKGGIN
jgi:hypothetical protein